MEVPLCDACGDRHATVYIQIIGADVQQEKRLCAECAMQHQLDDLPLTVDISPEGEIDISVRPADLGPKVEALPGLPDERCADCGTTSADVASTGLVGCPDCYENMPRTIAGLVATVQPSPAAIQAQRREPLGLSRLGRLQLQLAEAVGKEDYDRAARLRDEIGELHGEASGVEG